MTASRKLPAWFGPGLLCVGIATALAYAPTLQNGLTNWDDDGYILQNPWLGQSSWPAFQSMFVMPYKGNYHPLTMISFWTDHWISGGSVAWYHGVNLLLHLLNTALAAGLVWSLTRRAGIVLATAALFGLHPLHVESVAWVSERKDVLYTFFSLASLWLYSSQAARPETSHRGLGLIATFALFAAALLSKGVAVSIVPSLLLIDWVHRRRLDSPGLWLEKIPFFALAMVSGWITLQAQAGTGQLDGLSQWTAVERVALGCAAYVRYIGLTFFPTGLSAFHPYPERVEGALPLLYWTAPFVFVAVQALTLFCMRRLRWVAFGLAFFSVNIALLLQWIPVGGALIAERYTYLPSLGLFLAATAAVAHWLDVRPARQRLVGAGFVLICALLAATTFARSQVWHDSLSLWDDTLAQYPDVPVARLNRSLARYQQGQIAEALSDLDAALVAEPGYAKAYGHRGVMRFQAGNSEGALQDLEESLRIEPTLEGYLNRGAIRLAAGYPEQALEDCDLVLSADPNQPLAWANRGLALNELGRPGAAIADFDRALALAPTYLPAYLGRAEARLALGSNQTALKEADALLVHSPELPEALFLRARALKNLDQPGPACRAFSQAADAGSPMAQTAWEAHCAGR
ncbi:MAG: tetratricopeptide repeat protein [Myxococcota bacterium]|nr:tetratricopeptide repeat protein [Myxococcota bacterium]